MPNTMPQNTTFEKKLLHFMCMGPYSQQRGSGRADHARIQPGSRSAAVRLMTNLQANAARVAEALPWVVGCVATWAMDMPAAGPCRT